MQLVWPGVAILSIHLSIPDWPSWNQSSAFEGQSGSTRVQRICKKLQTVRGAGWPAAWSLFPGCWEIFLMGKEKLGLQRLLEGQTRGRKEIWAERLLEESVREIFKGESFCLGVFGGRILERKQQS